MKKIDGKVSNTAKVLNIATELNEFKSTLLNKKVLRHKMRRIQGKKHKMGTYEINKISLSCTDDERFVLNDGTHMLDYFLEDLKKIDSHRCHKQEEIQKDSHEKKRFSQMNTNKNKCIQVNS